MRPCFLALISLPFILNCAVDLPGSATRGGSPGLDLSPTAQKKTQGALVAQIGSTTLTLETLQNRLGKQSPFVQARYEPEDKRKEFLDNQIRYEVLALEAFKKGIHLDDEVQESIKKIIVQKLTREEFDGRVKLSDVTEAAMKAYYEKNQEEYNKPEMVRASVIRVKFAKDRSASQKRAAAAHSQASLKDKLKDRNHFKSLVSEFSDHEDSVKMGGDLRYLGRADFEKNYGKAIADTVWTLPEINDLSPLMEGKDGYYIFKKTGSRRPIVRTFEQVQNQIRNLLYRDLRKADFEKYIDSLKEKYSVNVQYDKLKDLVIAKPSQSDPFHADHGDKKPGATPTRTPAH
jgi:peptidyl-prolyl cis-trans isomerase C